MKQMLSILMVVSVCLLSRAAVGGENWQCNEAQIQSHTFGDPENSYIISWQCNSDDGDNVQQQKITYYGRWNQKTGKATEHIDDHFLYWYKGDKKNDRHYSYDVEASCPDDPWISGAQCFAATYTVVPSFPVWQGNIPHSPPSPRSSTILTSATRQSLQQEYAGQRAAPVIVAPNNGATYDFPVDIPVTVHHNPNHGIRFKIEWRPDMQHAPTQVTNSILFGVQTGNGITTAKLHPIKEGEWTLRAQLETNADPWWSDPCGFTVKTGGAGGVLGSPPTGQLRILSPQASQVITGDVQIKLELDGYPEATTSSGPEVLLDWWWSPPTSPGAWPETPKQMNVRPKMQGTHLTIPRNAFAEKGLWRLLATVKLSENFAILDDVHFKIQDFQAGENLQLSKTIPVKSKLMPQAIAPYGNMPATAIKERPALGMRGTLTAAPTIIKPMDNERIARPGSVQINTRVSQDEAVLHWQIEYKGFGDAMFRKQSDPSKGALTAGRGTFKTTRLTFSAPGHYRFRVKEDNDTARWSSWRNVVVGTPPLAPAGRTMQRKTVPMPTDDVDKTPVQKQEQSPKLQRQAPSQQIKPATDTPSLLRMTMPQK